MDMLPDSAVKGSFTVEVSGDEEKLRRLLSAFFTSYSEMLTEEDKLVQRIEREYGFHGFNLRRKGVPGIEGKITVRGALLETRL